MEIMAILTFFFDYRFNWIKSLPGKDCAKTASWPIGPINVGELCGHWHKNQAFVKKCKPLKQVLCFLGM